MARYYQSIMDSYVEINGIFRPGEEALGNLGAGNNDLQIPCDLFLPQRSVSFHKMQKVKILLF